MTAGAKAMAIDLPPSPYLPGRTERPDEGYFDALKEGLETEESIEGLAASAAFQGGLAAFHREYFWEAHELWEAVWMRLPAASAERHLVQGLIQYANAGLKTRMGRQKAAGRIRELAERELEEAFMPGRDAVFGLTRGDAEALGALAMSGGGGAGGKGAG